MHEGYVSSHAIRQVYHMQDNDAWLRLRSLFRIGSLFGFWPYILSYIIQIKCFSCKKGWCHLMQSNKCITRKIVMSKLSLYHYLGFDYLFWLISFKPSSYHSSRFGFISCKSNKCIKCKILICDLCLDQYMGFYYLFWPIPFKPGSYDSRRFGGI